MQIKKKNSSVLKTVEQEPNEVYKAKDMSSATGQVSAKSGAIPMSVSAALGSLKTKPVSTTGTGSFMNIKTAESGVAGLKGVSSKAIGEIGQVSEEDSKREEYKERLKKRAK